MSTKRDYAAQKALLNGETVEVEGIPVKFRDGDIEPGDLYVAERNGGPKLLTCKSYSDDGSWINPDEKFAYCYDTWECTRVEAVL